jgi:Tfp pilus assembly ATPase PilU
MQTFDQSLLTLYEQGLVTMHDAMAVATNPHDFKLMVQARGHEVALVD